MRNLIWLLLTGLMMCITTGCGVSGGNQTQNPITPNGVSPNNISANLSQVLAMNAPDMYTGEQKKKHFDDEISKSMDSVAMEQTIRDFCTYTMTRDTERKVAVSDKDMKKLAEKELSSRYNPQISPAKLVRILEKRAKDLGVTDTKLSQEVEMVQNMVRADMPHIANDPKNKNMTPFEALVITYGIFTADDGRASPKTLGVSNIPQDKLDILIKDLIEDKED